MTSTPMHHPEDDAQPHPEDQGERSPATANEGEDLVDERTKELSREEAEQHDDIIDAQKDETGGPEQGGYGH